MQILAVSGSLRAGSYNTSSPARSGRGRPGGRRGRALRAVRHRRPAAVRPGSRRRRRPGGGRAPARRVGLGGRHPLLHARVQRLGSRRPEERDRLGVAPAARGGAHEQDRRGRQRQHRPVRRDVGAGRPAQDPRHRRRTRRRRRAAGHARAGALRPRGTPARRRALRAAAAAARDASPPKRSPTAVTV